MMNPVVNASAKGRKVRRSEGRCRMVYANSPLSVSGRTIAQKIDGEETARTALELVNKHLDKLTIKAVVYSHLRGLIAQIQNDGSADTLTSYDDSHTGRSLEKVCHVRESPPASVHQRCAVAMCSSSAEIYFGQPLNI